MAVFFSSAFAQQPTVQTFEFRDEVLVFDCGNFDAIFVDDITGRVTTYFDKDGNPERFQAHFRFDGTVTHSVTGQSFRDQAAVNSSGPWPPDNEEKDEAHMGVSVHITVPGEGLIALRVGRIVRDEEGIPIFVAGQNLETLYGDVVCEGLSGL